jgi:hypothetical protein
MKEVGRDEEALISYSKVIELKPDYAESYNNLGIVLKNLKRYDQAISNYKKAIKLRPSYPEAHYNLGNTYAQLGKYKQAVAYLSLESYEDSEAKILECLYKDRNYSAFNQRLESLAQLNDIDILVAALSAFAAHQLKQEDPYPFCKNPIDFFHVGHLSNHTVDVDSFVNDVILEAEQMHSVWEPANKTTILGFQTAAAIFKKGEHCSALEKMIMEEVKSYYSRFSKEGCTFIRSWPIKYDLKGWYVRLVKNGYQKSHIHPAAWMSGVVYLKTVGSADSDKGAIELGLHGYNLPIIDNNFPRTIHRPQIGDIVLFPSSLFHRTIPFQEDTDRCVIAFDLTPVRN